jgi:putative oxidoreductase
MSPMFIALGRVFLIIVFVYSGVNQLFDIGGTAEMLAAKISIPAQLTQYTVQLEQATGMPTMRLLAIFVGGLQVVCGLLIAFNIAARWFALLLAIHTIIATVLFHDFWNAADAIARNDALNHLLKNVAILGGLLLVVGIGPPARDEREPQFDDH